jgi:hypothetical protein
MEDMTETTEKLTVPEFDELYNGAVSHVLARADIKKGEREMANKKGQKAQPGNGAAWDTIGNAKWLKGFPFTGGPDLAFEAKAAIVPAVPGSMLQGSQLLLALHFMGGNKTEGVNLTLSYAQAKAVSEILQNFLTSRETAHEAIRGAFVNPEGAVRWGTSPQAV